MGFMLGFHSNRTENSIETFPEEQNFSFMLKCQWRGAEILGHLMVAATIKNQSIVKQSWYVSSEIFYL